MDIEFFWVEGHQMERYGHSSYEGDINDMCENLAKLFWNSTRDMTSLDNIRVGHHIWQPEIAGWTLAHLDFNQMYDFTFGRSVSIPYWQGSRQPIPQEKLRIINWNAVNATTKLWPWGKKKWMSKFMTGFAATGRVMYRRNEWPHNHCCMCFACNEDAKHVLSCP